MYTHHIYTTCTPNTPLNTLNTPLHGRLIPLAAFSFLCLAFVFEIIRDKCSGVAKLHIGRKFGKVIAQYLLMLYYVYLSVTRRALDIFNCNPSTPADGYYYTEFTSIDCEGGLCKCHIEGSVQVFLKPFAFLFICVYTIGFPLFLAVVIYNNYSLIKEDQILRAHNLQDTRESNPKAYDIRIRYHKMYYHFKPSKAYWIILITLRKYV